MKASFSAYLKPFYFNNVNTKMKLLGLVLLTVLSAMEAQNQMRYDIVLQGGRVIDPETALDTIKNVGISDGKIVEISYNDLSGKQVIDVKGFVVSPGFIDLHVHGISNKEQEYQIKDGVTTALELEWGVAELQQWYAQRNGKALINYGASVNWPYYRAKAMGAIPQKSNNKNQINYLELDELFVALMPSFETTLSRDRYPKMLKLLEKSLNEGGIGLGVPVGYLNGATREEVFEVYKFANKHNSLVFSHVRSGGAVAIQQAIANAMLSGASLHIVHMNSMALGEIGLTLEMVALAQEKGFDITTEVYPYTAASTGLNSAIFDAGWKERLAISYSDIQLVKTGERLTESTFKTNKANNELVIIHMMKPEWIAAGINTKNVMIASDGMPYSKLAHPRTAGTFSRILGKYVREDQLIDLKEALGKMTWLPAKRLEDIAPAMKSKGRLQIGADADITVFNPETIIDKATFEDGLDFSEGVEFVIVNGTLLLNKGTLIENKFPGQAILGKL
ncbi:amidohydrolase family protein [Winogradskyella sp. DF17]|uniref:Amidohydrolase family protein n=1 Tax=Winogradskyella pelagia TaxID=2819984 RepID=A0ABS3T159_9FLAO|nr:amidohydrolase family protein [Winogradskyella sp. DF17]MBO3116489.1 amidohydrolase family protein [Winogradskyella sp. DF17]